MSEMSAGMRMNAVSTSGHHEPLSLLTLVDMTLALESPQKDHTYAYMKSHEQDNAECLLQKEKDHNYSYCSKGTSRTKIDYYKLIHGRSSSEENLSRLPDTSPGHGNGSQRSDPPRMTADDSSLGIVKSRKCHSYETIFNPFLTEHTYSCAIPNLGRDIQSKNITNDDKIICSKSWPKENMFPHVDEMERRMMTLPANYKFDHTYARGQIANGNMDLCDDPDMSCTGSFSNRSTFSTKSLKSSVTSNPFGAHGDHTYEKCTLPKKSFSKGHIRESKFKFGNSYRSDHNYSGTSMPFPPSGSMDSLNMELSQSDTDSCDETAQEERKLAITSTFSAWLQLRKDHPYSSI